MAHGSAKPTGRPRILNDRDEQSVINFMDYQDTLQRGIVFFFNRGKARRLQKDNAVIYKSSSRMNWFFMKKIKVLA
uniref:Uncharacterized protein n=1 Tax=Caenorhabditis japonica TaxID=281687 RepID=A0A8R1HHW2_CAEJA